jgi:hypothetical protein
MNTTHTVSAGVLTGSAVYVGSWATLAPRSFYDSFPGLDRMWVGVDGPYNEHLVRDVGGLYLALAIAGVLALVWHDPRTMLMLGAAWTVFSVPHLAHHARHLGEMERVDAVGNLVTLGGTLLLALLLLVPAARTARAEEAR